MHEPTTTGSLPLQPVERQRRQRHRFSGTAALAGSSSSYAQASSQDEEAWEATYGQPVLRYGMSMEQGVRETMEDAVQVVPAGRCGFFFASECDPAMCSTVVATEQQRQVWSEPANGPANGSALERHPSRAAHAAAA